MKEETLDPEDWEGLKKLGYQMIDESIDFLKNVRDRKVWQPIPEETKEFLNLPYPRKPMEMEKIYENFKNHIAKYAMGNIHPRFWGWVIGTGTMSGAMADMLASVVNSNMGGGNHGPALVEQQVVNWAREIFGFPTDSSGLLVTGGSMANLIGLTVARNTMLKEFVRETGLQDVDTKFAYYGSSEMHNSLQKAVEMLGLGNQYLRRIPVDDNFQIRLDLLKEKIREDKAMGIKPLCLIANAGTVNTAAFDNLEELSKIAKEENMWYHIDGAFGALAYISNDNKQLTKGLQLADSLSFDFHKWFYVNFEAGCILVKNKQDHINAFEVHASYLMKHEKGIGSSGSTWFSDYGVELSRNFKALKIWFSFLEHGLDKYARLVDQNIAQAKYTGTLINETEDLELMAPVSCNIVCYRYNPKNRNLTVDELNHLNKNILMTLQEEGIAAPSYTYIKGNYVLRVAIVNHRSRIEDFDLLIEKTIEVGKR
ncbi:MAG: pyridoxal-dependent decarboxylase [Candidatus Heimdallarchaeota archaeon]|nr:pyridoxal-dependent decarboxylase [Candidatus Heimdallarchaeota archaeon]MDH5646979.1 pyridoxal-dependent decarboxylase [Candidatus Heimdallarchaeota archaeon]